MDTIYEMKSFNIRLRVSEHTTQEKITDSSNAVSLLKSIFEGLDSDQEHFVCLFLNKANKVTGSKVLASGGQDQAIVDPKIVFRSALLMGATALIVAHNHPSGACEPSIPDREITSKLVKVGALLEVRILDHIILANGTYSFAEHGLI